MARTFHTVLARLGVPTGDGRIIDPAGGSSRDLPLPLAWQKLSDDGHGGSQVVARLETIRIADGMVTGTGSMLESAPWEVIEQLEAGVIGPSVDLDDVEYVMDADERIVLTKWRISGATLVAIPAFADVSLTLDPLPAEPVTVPEPSNDYAEPWMYASAAPEQLPPADWFAEPSWGPLTVSEPDEYGRMRVAGLIAEWSTCHVGLPGCVTPPSSPTGYTYFHVAEQRTQDGATLPVGTLVAGPRHADAQLAFRAAQEHYDDPSAAVARVVAGENEHGIWVAGWILPSATSEALDVFRSSPVSGDWRRVGGSLELIGVCSVNTPGFPVRRVHFAAGHQRALIGSFGITPTPGFFPEPGKRQVTDPTDIARARLRWALASTED